MLQNYDIDIQDFIKFTNAGVEVASFVQVRDALIRKYKEVYGQDIDLSTGTADGIFVNNIALMINNILQTFKTYYSNLDVNTASGIYLDNLCALANITRKPATYSSASIDITNIGTTLYKNGVKDAQGNILSYEPITFIDQAGVEWIYNNYIELEPNVTTSIIVTCSEKGAIEAPAGWINQTLEILNINVSQSTDAIVGDDLESDDSLRNRRAQSTGVDGTTVLDSLVGSLLEISGIKDVKIYSNNTSIDQNAKDGTELNPHEVYVVLRYNEGVNVDDSTIGTIIYEKMTPGIYTIETEDPLAAGDDDYDKSYNYLANQDSNMILFETNVYWKKALPVSPNIEIKLNIFEYFTVDEVPLIGKTLLDYLNNLQISQDLKAQDVLVQTTYADPQFLNKTTFTVPTNGITITGATSGVYSNPDGYFLYNHVSDGVIDSTTDPDNPTCTFTISYQ